MIAPPLARPQFLRLTLGVMFIVLGAVKKAERARKGGR